MNYMQIIEAFYPTYGVRCDGDEATYANIDWGSETPIVQATLDDKWLDMVKASKIEELSEACADDIVQGFSSDVLGADHWYASTMEDQTNIIRDNLCVILSLPGRIFAGEVESGYLSISDNRRYSKQCFIY